MKEFIKLCKKTKQELKKYLKNELKKYYKEVIDEDGFLYVKGSEIALTAHMDTTPHVEYGNRKRVKNVKITAIKNKTIVSAREGIGGDDRCGIYIIMKLLKETDLRPTIVFCEDEEIGLVGSRKFTKTKYINDLKKMYYIIQIDRRGSEDIVFYDDENEEFHEYVAEITGYKEAIGSCSDISNLCPQCGIAGVNISCGYYNEHSMSEYVVIEEMENTYEKVKKLTEEGLKRGISYEYVEKVYFGNYWYEDTYLEVTFDNGKGDAGTEYFVGESIADVWYQFLAEHPRLTMKDVKDFDEGILTEDDYKELEEMKGYGYIV